MAKRRVQAKPRRLEVSRSPQEVIKEKPLDPLGGDSGNWLNPLFTECL